MDPEIRRLKQIATYVHGQTRRLADALEAAGHEVLFSDYVDTLRVRTADGLDAVALARDQFGINLRAYDDGTVGVALDEGGWDAVGPFADEMGINYPVAVDDGTVDGLYGPTVSFPTTFVIDREGNVAHYVPGMILRDDLEPLLRPLLDAPGS